MRTVSGGTGLAEKVPRYRELRITETPEGVVVDFAPDMFVAPTLENQPAESNPDVKIDLGTLGGKLVPIRAKYPPGTTPEEIMNKVDLLFAKLEYCPSCERKKREMLEKLRRMMAERGRGDLFERMVQKAKEKEAIPPQVAPEKEWKMRKELDVRLKDLEQRMNVNVTRAIDDAYVAVRGFFVPPVKLVRPDDWMKMVQEGGGR